MDKTQKHLRKVEKADARAKKSLKKAIARFNRSVSEGFPHIVLEAEKTGGGQ
jgi:hypothetical protein